VLHYVLDTLKGPLKALMKEKFETIVRHLIGTNEETGPITGIEISDQFRPGQATPEATQRNLNAAFLIGLSGNAHPLYSEAQQFIADLGKRPPWKQAVEFYRKGLSLVSEEIVTLCKGDNEFRKNLDQLSLWVRDPQNLSDQTGTLDRLWRVFFPEGVSLLENREHNIASLRRKREIQITRLNPFPIQDPAREVLFTSNALLTLPAPFMRIDDLALSKDLKDRLKKVRRESQVYWYDHPVQIGVKNEENEVLYGLTGLDRAIGFEKGRGALQKDARVHCILSASVTHQGLHDLARSYLEETLKGAKGIRHLHVYALTGFDTARLVEEILAPGAGHYLGVDEAQLLHEIIGVDGEYGRHYSFLKAISAFWQVFLDPGIRASFKIDLDQVFPQNELVTESGASAFEHLKTPLWGAEGMDQDGNRVDLGMIAGALVNQSDLGRALFTPDVIFSNEDIQADEWIFCSRLPQAVSTVAEMMTRYTDKGINGRDGCIQRFHVTGGTSGILVDRLRRFRPFTPSFIGRAEDQAYILSVLFRKPDINLRYVHKDGLIMRHDKEVFAGEAVRSAYIGKIIGDYVRILLFSYYSRILPWSVQQTKHAIDPFTGCFVTSTPLTVVYLRLALQGASLFRERRGKEGFDLLKMGVDRLSKVIAEVINATNPLSERYNREGRAWDIFYDFLEKAEEGLKRDDPVALELKKKAIDLMRECEIKG
jgi:hypothetical protein